MFLDPKNRVKYIPFLSEIVKTCIYSLSDYSTIDLEFRVHNIWVVIS